MKIIIHIHKMLKIYLQKQNKLWTAICQAIFLWVKFVI